MKLILNLSTISPPMSGIGQYVYRLLSELLKNEEITDVCGFVRLKWLKDKQEIISYLEMLQNTSMKPTTWDLKYAKARKFFVDFTIARFIYYHMRDVIFKHKLKSDFIYWDGAYTPISFNGKMIITVHDLSHIRHSEFHPKSRVEIMNAYLPKAIRNSAHILTVSEFSKQEIMDIFHVPDTKISIIPPSTSEHFKPLDEEACKAVLKQYCLSYKKYILSVATLEPRKNLSRLLEAYLKLPDTLKKEYPLVFVGSLGWSYDGLYQKLESLQKQGMVKMLGYVIDDDLPALYASAQCFAYVSIYEGYGMPIAEAIQTGTPCITSNKGAMLEVAGKDAICVDPFCIEAIKEGLKEALKMPHEFSPPMKKSILSPKEAAIKFFDVLKQVQRS